ncbi:MAG: ribosome assembly cofactor RimP [Bacteroidales bacterium]|nr:ribosome assembly cofactor RimP [Bacteroidales bacterium]
MIDKQHIEQLVNQKLSGTEYFLASCDVTHDNKIIVALDGDRDVSIDQCILVSRFLESSLDRDQEDFELQVTSYGANMPLLNQRQYKKYLNRPVHVTTIEDKILEGELLSVDEQELKIEPVIKPKKKGQKPKKGEAVVLQLAEIKEIKPVMKF